jgi:hypothetical protein
MCLRLALERPEHVLAAGTHAGFEWVVMQNRCGYVKVPVGHPWHGHSYWAWCWDMVDVHGGITFSSPDTPCGKGGDDGWWLGFEAEEDVEGECRKLCDAAAAAGARTVSASARQAIEPTKGEP